HMGHRIELSEIELAAQKLAERACAIFKNYKINLFFTGVCDESVLMGELKKIYQHICYQISLYD
ncbi:MAG: hypothetical protein ACOCM3_08010, partial [Campylobacter hyointestinalis]